MAVANMPMADQFEQFKARFEKNIAGALKQVRRDIGELLVDAQESLDERYFKALCVWLKDKHRISLSEQQVCIRIANGEMSEEQAELIPPSIAQFIATENLPHPDKEYHIYSPDVGAPVKKKFRHFSKMEKKVNLSVHGVKPLGEAAPAPKHKPFDTAVASGYRIDGSDLVLIVNSLNKEIRHRITPAFVKQISAAIKG